MSSSIRGGEAWKHRHYRWKSGEPEPRIKRKLKVEPQFSFEQLYISPLHQQQWNGTGIHILDEYARMLSEGATDFKPLYERYGVSAKDFSSLAFILTGLSAQEMRMKYQVRIMDELLRFTDMPPAEVARRSGIGTLNNLYLVCKRTYNQSPVEHRKKMKSSQ
jgi:AraC-like DNA-binding protein